jgi:hypothetical protein
LHVIATARVARFLPRFFSLHDFQALAIPIRIALDIARRGKGIATAYSWRCAAAFAIASLPIAN